MNGWRAFCFFFNAKGAWMLLPTNAVCSHIGVKTSLKTPSYSGLASFSQPAPPLLIRCLIRLYHPGSSQDSLRIASSTGKPLYHWPLFPWVLSQRADGLLLQLFGSCAGNIAVAPPGNLKMANHCRKHRGDGVGLMLTHELGQVPHKWAMLVMNWTQPKLPAPRIMP